MNPLKLTFKNNQGHDLSARLDLPESKPAAYAIFAHFIVRLWNVLRQKRKLMAIAISLKTVEPKIKWKRQ